MHREGRSRRWTVLVAGGWMLLAAGSAGAWDEEPRQERREMDRRIDSACQEALASFCAEERGPEKVRCLMEHYADASAECQALLDQDRQRREQERERRSQALEEACGENAEALCPGEEGPGLLHCLMDHRADASAECQALLDRIRQRHEQGRERRRQALDEACGESAEALCPGKEGPERVDCLMDHYADASTECRALLDRIRSRGRPGPGRQG